MFCTFDRYHYLMGWHKSVWLEQYENIKSGTEVIKRFTLNSAEQEISTANENWRTDK